MNENICVETSNNVNIELNTSISNNHCNATSNPDMPTISNNAKTTIVESNEKKKRRKSVKDSTLKIEILELIDKGKKVNNLAIEYGVGASTIRDWMKSRDKIKELDNLNRNFNLSKKTLKNSDYPQVDKALSIWYKQQLSSNKPISADLVSEKAKYFKQFLDLDKTKAIFSASHGFVTNFFQRHEYLTNERKSYDTLEEQLKQQDFTKEQIFILEETDLVWKTLPNNNYGSVSNEKIQIGTIFNCTGSFKLPLIIIDKSLRFDEKIKLPIYYAQNTEIVFTKMLFKEWFNSEFVPKVEAFCKSINREPKAVLLVELNHIREHLTSSNGLIKCMFRPKNASVEKTNLNSFTKWIKKAYKFDLIRELIISDKDKHFLTNYSFKKCIKIIVALWLNIPIPMLKNFWKIYGFNLNEPQVSNYEININNLLAMSKKLDFETEKIKSWFKSEKFDGYCIITDEEIIKKVLNDQNSSVLNDQNASVLNDQSIPQIDENNRSINYEESIRVTDSQAISSVDTLINWLESQTNLDQSYLSKALEIRNLVCKNKLSDENRSESNEAITLKQNTSIINKEYRQIDAIDLSKMSDTLRQSIIDDLTEPIKKRNKIVLDNSVRIKILKSIDEGSKINDLATEYGIGSTTIRDWLKVKDKILEKKSGKITNYSKNIPYIKKRLRKKSAKNINKILDELK